MSDTNTHDDAVPTNDEDGTTKPDGLGDEGTIPNHPEGVAAGFADDDSHFNHEEDGDAE